MTEGNVSGSPEQSTPYVCITSARIPHDRHHEHSLAIQLSVMSQQTILPNDLSNRREARSSNEATGAES